MTPEERIERLERIIDVIFNALQAESALRIDYRALLRKLEQKEQVDG